MKLSYHQMRKTVLEMLNVTPADIGYLEICHSNMVQRCTNKRDWSFRFYGGRGIQVCPRWSGPMGCLFFIFDILTRLGHRPPGQGKSGLSLFHLDRFPDRGGNYTPTNVRWVVWTENQKCKRGTKEYQRMMAGMFTNASAQTESMTI
jgi:hypothetical protein